MHMALSTHRWTRADLERMPDDGNRYEVIHGELLVSPAPLPVHAALVYAFRRTLEPFCEREGLGMLGENHAHVDADSETIPDLVVRKLGFPPPKKWDHAAIPSLIVEVLSESTRRNDLTKKRSFYLESGVPEYWVVDGNARSLRVVTPAGERIETGTFTWHPAGAGEALVVDLPELFTRVLGPREP